ncbi:hypothetical protein [Sphingobacterium deserti]|uniref:Lipoprotein n=1 Tax=Sphingobacterium deserti TaxID=1229276 RepID=A0A0B8T347_9SPHI|nr:hypothetical protein [Sphingobacterium deserti]KGE15461.1 hypothetical protein DI53_0834 [Sphingobacterium deserti]
MIKKRLFQYIFIILTAVVGFFSCERNDAEPDLQMRRFSRLYVSFEGFGSSNTVPDSNVRTIYPADSTSIFRFSQAHVSNAQGGGPIFYQFTLETLFQASANLNGVNDTSAYILNVGRSTGVLKNVGRMGNRLFNSVRGMAYHELSNRLFIVNGSGANAGVYVMDSPRSRTGFAPPVKKLQTQGYQMWGAAYANNKLLVSRLGAGGGLCVFDNITTVDVRPTDSIADLRSNARTLPIEGAQNLRGLCYDTVKNVLAIADFSNDGAASSGRILVFENFSEIINSVTGTMIRPTRIITGEATGLTQPVEVVIDPRETGTYMYVADRGSRVISRFSISDDGNVAPNQTLSTGNQIPVGLAIDVRAQQ